MPYQLHTRYREALRRNGFPEGPLIMKRFFFGRGAEPLRDHVTYKTGRIMQVAKLLSKDYRLTLLGDTGEQDSQVYSKVTQRLGSKRVVGTYLRQVTRSSTGYTRGGPSQWVFSDYARRHTTGSRSRTTKAPMPRNDVKWRR